MSGYRLQRDGGGRRLMGGMGWWTEDAGGFTAGGEVVLAPTEYEWGIGRVGGTMFWSGTHLFLAFLNRRWDALV